MRPLLGGPSREASPVAAAWRPPPESRRRRSMASGQRDMEAGFCRLSRPLGCAGALSCGARGAALSWIGSLVDFRAAAVPDFAATQRELHRERLADQVAALRVVVGLACRRWQRSGRQSRLPWGAGDTLTGCGGARPGARSGTRRASRRTRPWRASGLPRGPGLQAAFWVVEGAVRRIPLVTDCDHVSLRVASMPREGSRPPGSSRGRMATCGGAWRLAFLWCSGLLRRSGPGAMSARPTCDATSWRTRARGSQPRWLVSLRRGSAARHPADGTRCYRTEEPRTAVSGVATRTRASSCACWMGG